MSKKPWQKPKSSQLPPKEPPNSSPIYVNTAQTPKKGKILRAIKEQTLLLIGTTIVIGIWSTQNFYIDKNKDRKDFINDRLNQMHFLMNNVGNDHFRLLSLDAFKSNISDWAFQDAKTSLVGTLAGDYCSLEFTTNDLTEPEDSLAVIDSRYFDCQQNVVSCINAQDTARLLRFIYQSSVAFEQAHLIAQNKASSDITSLGNKNDLAKSISILAVAISSIFLSLKKIKDYLKKQSEEKPN